MGRTATKKSCYLSDTSNIEDFIEWNDLQKQF